MLLVIYTSSGNWTGSSFPFRLKQQHATSKKISNKTGERIINTSIRIKNQIFKDSRNNRVITTPFSNEVLVVLKRTNSPKVNKTILANFPPTSKNSRQMNFLKVLVSI